MGRRRSSIKVKWCPFLNDGHFNGFWNAFWSNFFWNLWLFFKHSYLLKSFISHYDAMKKFRKCEWRQSKKTRRAIAGNGWSGILHFCANKSPKTQQNWVIILRCLLVLFFRRPLVECNLLFIDFLLFFLLVIHLFRFCNSLVTIWLISLFFWINQHFSAEVGVNLRKFWMVLEGLNWFWVIFKIQIVGGFWLFRRL